MIETITVAPSFSEMANLVLITKSGIKILLQVNLNDMKII